MSNDDLFAALDGAVRIAGRLAALPAVATMDWANDAAAALAQIARPSRVCFIIGSLDSSGGIVAHETVGVASSQAPGLADDLQTQDLTVRSRAERLNTVGFRPTEAAFEHGVVAPISRLTDGETWREGQLGQLWSGMPVGDLLIGLIRLGRAEPGRVLFVQVAIGDNRRAGAHEIGLLRSLLPMLQHRTLMAVGDHRATTNRWLTLREQQVLELLTLGKSVRTIAEELDRSPHTVHDHVKSLHKKLSASSRGELVARALGHVSSAEQADDQSAQARSNVMFLLHDIAVETTVDPSMRQPAGRARPMTITPAERPEVIVPKSPAASQAGLGRI